MVDGFVFNYLLFLMFNLLAKKYYVKDILTIGNISNNLVLNTNHGGHGDYYHI